MKACRITLLIASALISSHALAATEAEEVTKSKYEKSGESKAVITLHVN